MFTAAFSCSETPASRFLLPARPPLPASCFPPSHPAAVLAESGGVWLEPQPQHRGGPRSHQVSAVQPRALGSNQGRSHMVSVSQTPPKI